jgi:hypothetical protein
MVRVIASVLGCVLLAGCADAGEDSGPVVMLDGFVVCTTCELEVSDADTLEAESSLGLIPGNPADLEVTSDGRLAAVFSAGGEPLWFDSAGSIVGPIGRMGDGPGEYRRPTTLAAAPDSLVVFESLGRVTVVDLESDAVRTIPLFPVMIEDVVVLSWPDRVLVSYRGGPPVDTVHSLLIFDLSGTEPEIVDEIDAWSQLEDERALYRRRVARSAHDAFWALDYADYRITLRDTAGQIIAEAHRTAEWAPDGSTDLGYGPQKAPPAWMEAVHQDADGRVWILTRVPRHDWEVAWTRRGITEIPRSEMPSGWGPRQDELWETRVEVFSTGLDSLIVSDVLPGVYDGFVSDGRLVRFSQTDVGFPIVELMTVRVDDRGGPGSS